MQLNDCQPTCFSRARAIFLSKIALSLTIPQRDNYHALFAVSIKLLTMEQDED